MNECKICSLWSVDLAHGLCLKTCIFIFRFCYVIVIFAYSKKNFDVQSFGTGAQVKLPGPAANKPNIYSFDWKYEDILVELKRKDQTLYPLSSQLMLLLIFIVTEIDACSISNDTELKNSFVQVILKLFFL